MTTTLTIAELEQADGLDLGASSWRTVDQHAIELFADATDDHQWIHIDAERAAAGPFGATIAHGYLTLSMLPAHFRELLVVSDAAMKVNYGIDRLRFTGPVRSGSQMRVHAKVSSPERRGTAVVYHLDVSVEIQGAEKPALVGNVIFLADAGEAAS